MDTKNHTGSRKKHSAEVLASGSISNGIYELLLKTPLACSAHPGQFVMIYPDSAAMLLPRPISICDTDVSSGTLRLVYRVAGSGTAGFSRLTPGSTVQILGPLGNGFPTEDAWGKTVLLMGGGIGIPPMLYLAKALREQGAGSVIAALGYRDSDLFLKDDFDSHARCLFSTDDGSTGTKGTVIDAAKAEGIRADIIYACGPMPMLRGVKAYAEEQGIPAYISLEERMACGVGACLGCVCRTVHKDSHSQVNNARVCTEGPVFHASEVEI